MVQRAIEAVFAYPIDWGDTAAWVQGAGSIIAIAVAIAVPAKQEAQRQRAAAEEMVRRRRAAWKAMLAITGVLGRKGRATVAEVDAMAAVLDQLDLSVFPEPAMEVFVGLRNRVAMARAEVEIKTGVRGIHALSPPALDRVELYFNADAAMANLATIKSAMGLGDDSMPAYRRPRTLPGFLRSTRDNSPEEDDS
jgi:hypothetical protein